MQVVKIALNRKKETPAAGYSGLPDAPGFIVLLSAERGVAQILEKQLGLFEKGFLDLRRSTRQRFQEPL